VHYYQKFKLKCDLLHPLDLLLVIEKIKQERKKEGHTTDLIEQKIEGAVKSLSKVEHMTDN